MATNILNQGSLTSTKASVKAGFYSNQAQTTPDSTSLLSSSCSPINYQVCHQFGWYESLQLHWSLVDEIGNPCLKLF